MPVQGAGQSCRERVAFRIADILREGMPAGRRDDLNCHWLIAPELIIVASPNLLAKGPPIATLGDCLQYPLIHDIERRDWRLLCEALRKTAVTDAGPTFAKRLPKRIECWNRTTSDRRAGVSTSLGIRNRARTCSRGIGEAWSWLAVEDHAQP